MKRLSLEASFLPIALAGLALLQRDAVAQHMRYHPIPPGAQVVEEPTSPRPKIDSAAVQQQSDELLELAQQVHTSTTTQGLPAKDLKQKLKRMERLSRHLRDELVQ